MKSLKGLYRIGPGPSSSHTIAPYRAALAFRKQLHGLPVSAIEITFYGSLALTGEGHASHKAVVSALKSFPTTIHFDRKTSVSHPLTMLFVALDEHGFALKETHYYSLGGGELHSDEDPSVNEKDIYPFCSFADIKKALNDQGLSTIKDLCLRYEDPDIDDYLMNILKTMFASVKNGLSAEGPIPANRNPRLQLHRSAKAVFAAAEKIGHRDGKKEITLSAYAYGVAENSACGETIVTAPTCGSSGVLPACLYYLHVNRRIPLKTLRDSLYVAGMIGNIVKQNASIAGSIGGCQAEIGTASSMAAAAICYCMGLSLHQMEYAAECAMEHFLGLSCDPVDGYVIIPCIERNGIAAIRASASYLFARHIEPVRKNQVSFDNVVEAMKLTGDSLSYAYKETAEGGLAAILRCN